MSSMRLLFSRDKFLVYLITLGFFLSQFYLWSSGLPQFSHLVIMLAIIVSFYRGGIINTYLVKILFIFLVYVILVNIIWYIIYLDFSYINSILYWGFNFLFFLLMVSLLNKDKNKDKFIQFILFVIPLSYILEIFIWIIGMGRYYFSPRYNGLFNDPNQMAFWTLSTCAIYLLLSKNRFKNSLVYVLALFLIILTMSRSAFLGFLFITFSFLIKQKGDLYNKIFLIMLSSIFVSLIAFYLYLKGFFDEIIDRFIQGFGEKDSQSEGRGFNVILNYPEYLFFGAGQGNYKLYNLDGNEIHSTWLGILFYYGLVGFFIFLYFLFNIIKKLNFSDKLLIMAPLLYGFTTYNARTIIFWFVISVFLLLSKDNFKKLKVS